MKIKKLDRRYNAARFTNAQYIGVVGDGEEFTRLIIRFSEAFGIGYPFDEADDNWTANWFYHVKHSFNSNSPTYIFYFITAKQVTYAAML